MPPSIYRVVAAVDLSPASMVVLETAYAAVRALGEAELHAVTVVRVAHPSEPRGAAAVDAAHRRLRELASNARLEFEPYRGPKPSLFLHTRNGAPAAEEILALSAEARADLIVVGAHVPNPLTHIFSRPTPHAVVLGASCAVLVAQHTRYDTSQLVPRFRSCQACRAVRAETGGAEWFCELHRAQGFRNELLG